MKAIQINDAVGEVIERGCREWGGQVFDVPELDELEGWVFDSVCETLDGDMVEPDGWNVEGCPSWLLVLGLV